MDKTDYEPLRPTNKELLLLAVAKFGSSPQQMTSQHLIANGIEILQQALKWGRLWTEDSRRSLLQENYDRLIKDWCSWLTELCREEPILVYGSWSHDPLCYATYAGFGLTPEGWEVTKSLFERFPNFRASDA